MQRKKISPISPFSPSILIPKALLCHLPFLQIPISLPSLFPHISSSLLLCHLLFPLNTHLPPLPFLTNFHLSSVISFSLEMGKYGLFDLERQYAFHGAYHSNQVNTWIHMLFIWPIFFTFLVMYYFTPPIFDCPFQSCLGLVPNFGLLFTMTYVVYYVCLDRKAGSLAAFLCLFCWVSASLLAKHLGFSLAWKILISCSTSFALLAEVVLGVQLFCWTTQLIGHVVFEKRSPPLAENFAQALLMVPYFVLLEALQSFFGYEPYPGFNASVKARKDAEIQNLKDNKEKKIS
ncbi:hypothetical protein RHSIM_Rhsim08G0153100 [Rhododendron simsii]|uniref:Endoplasmic reticulum membrane protein C16E8.02 n=1 Tax=Rhododendron simsii TaxID=118357 RepID=A0A834GI87_RHOSS|nr:hypothetical protein RHSIM_Rhsim08G0153100 [Rhododendron simsii]